MVEGEGSRRSEITNASDNDCWVGGGGFSDVFGIPDYQMDAVAQYKNSPDANLPLRRFWNDTGRGFPDVAALGGRKVGYCICAYDRYGDGKWQHVSGTSASAPVVAGCFCSAQRSAFGRRTSSPGFLEPVHLSESLGFSLRGASHCEAH